MARARTRLGIIDQYLSTLGDGSVKSLLLSYYALMDILIASAKLISEMNGNVTEVLPEVSAPEKLVSHIGTPKEFRAVATGILNRVYDFRDSRAELRYSSVINKARAYIDANFNKQDISLHSVATSVNISPNHFSTIFSQETGETFIEYLTRVRINRAKELLRTTAMRSSEIPMPSAITTRIISAISLKSMQASPRANSVPSPNNIPKKSYQIYGVLTAFVSAVFFGLCSVKNRTTRPTAPKNYAVI